MRRFSIYFLMLISLILSGCRAQKKAQTGSDGIVDVIYLVSTNVLSATDENGNEVYRATLCKEDSLVLRAEMDYVREHMFGEPFNFISPYYHQFTFNAISLSKDAYDSVYEDVVKEIEDFFDNYIRNENNGRHYILAGFSQGAMLVCELLKYMDDDAFSKMDAAYMLGYRLTEEDLAHPHIQAAQSDSDRQVTISFNTVLSEEGIWPLVTEGTVTCINPVNWCTDSTPATFSFNDQDVTISVDTQNHVIMADTDPTYFHEWMQSVPAYANAGVSDDCLHHWDLLFYCQNLYENACLRSGISPVQ